jgi:hypothetical protein
MIMVTQFTCGNISAVQWTDAYRNVERVCDPGTEQVYDVPAGWYDEYDLRRQRSGKHGASVADEVHRSAYCGAEFAQD